MHYPSIIPKKSIPAPQSIEMNNVQSFKKRDEAARTIQRLVRRVAEQDNLYRPAERTSQDGQSENTLPTPKDMKFYREALMQAVRANDPSRWQKIYTLLNASLGTLIVISVDRNTDSVFRCIGGSTSGVCIGSVILANSSTVKSVIRDFRRYCDNPNVLSETLEGQQTHYSTTSYDTLPSTDAGRIKQSLQNHLGQNTNLISIRYICSSIEAITQGLELTEQQYVRLNTMLTTNAEREVQLVWTYFENNKTGEEQTSLKKDFVRYLSTTEGCMHGRKNQVLQFFLGGIDPDIFHGVEFPHLVQRIPRTQERRNNLLGTMTHALTAAQLNGDLDINSSERDEKAYLKRVLVPNSYNPCRKKPPHGITLQMTNAVFEQAFRELQEGMLSDNI